MADTAIRWQHTLVEDATTDDTLRAIVATVRVYRNSEFARKAVEAIRQKAVDDGQNPNDKLVFIHNLFEWACRNHDYKLDPLGNEIIRTPDLTVRLKHADCKKFSILLGSILAAAGIEPIFKHVEYADEPDFTHIYTLVRAKEVEPDNTQHTDDLRLRHNYFVLDPTNHCSFNKEVEHIKPTLHFLNGETMKLTMMGWNKSMQHSKSWDNLTDIGTGAAKVLDQAENINVPGMGLSIHDLIKRGAHAINAKWHIGPMLHAHGHGIMQHILKVIPGSNLFNSTKHIHIDQQRGAFLELVKSNYNGMASHLLKLVATKPDALNELWHQTGGSIDELKTAILEGSKEPIIQARPEHFTATAEEKAHGLSLAPAHLMVKGIEPIDTNPYSMVGRKHHGFFKHLLHAAAGILHAVAPIANAIIPGAGTALNHVADGAERLANDLPEKKADTPGGLAPSPSADLVPTDNSGVKNIPRGAFGPTGGSLMGSWTGWFFFGMFDTMAAHNIHFIASHFSAHTIDIVGSTIAIAGALFIKFFKITA